MLEELTTGVNTRLQAALDAAEEFDCPNSDVTLQRLHGVLSQSSLWIRTDLPARKKAQLREAVVSTASRMFGS